MKTKRVLVVDDNEGVRKSTGTNLRLLRVAWDEASNIQEAKELLETHRYDLILSDNTMEEADDGLKLLAYVRAHERHEETPFVLLTGDDSEHVVPETTRLKGVYRSKFARKPTISDFILRMLGMSDASENRDLF